MAQQDKKKDDKKKDGVILVSEETHKKLRLLAAEQGKTIKEVAEELFKKGGLDENED